MVFYVLKDTINIVILNGNLYVVLNTKECEVNCYEWQWVIMRIKLNTNWF